MGELVEDPGLKDRTRVFIDRSDAGQALARSLRAAVPEVAVVMAIPSGGIPVAAEISKELGWPLDLMIVRKLQVSFEPEAGFGAITLGGQTILNRRLMDELDLTDEDVAEAREKALKEGRSREIALRRGRKPISLTGSTAVLVDDGLASGYTMLAAIIQARVEGAKRVVVAVPTGSDSAVRLVLAEADLVICLNIRGGAFAVADAYMHWYDLTENESVAIMRGIA